MILSIAQVLVLSVLTDFQTTALQNPFSACPKYEDYSKRAHAPLSRDRKGLPYQRPTPECRLFVSTAVEEKVKSMNERLKNPDVARLFENCLPNTLDTTIRWHSQGSGEKGPQTFVITGDINAMWLRDSTFQLQPYLGFAAAGDADLKTLLNGAIQTQSRYISQYPYCNAFQPPRDSQLKPSSNNQNDVVQPPYNPEVVFECKYEIDSLSSFLRLSRQYYQETKDASMFTQDWISAVQKVLRVVQEQSQPSFNPLTHLWNPPSYTFRRQTDMATETLALGGAGYPVNGNTSLVRSAFRPSDDSTILQLFIPGNAMLSVELGHLSELLLVAHKKGVKNADAWSDLSLEMSRAIRQGIYDHAVFEHPLYGKVFAYEIDGYGGRIFQDDANMPSLLSLPLLGFLEKDDPIYLNTRRMILSSQGNPYFLKGTQLSGIGSPHTPTRNVWPMSLLIQIMTSNDQQEITACLEQVLSSTAELGLIHESINVITLKHLK